MNEDQNPSNGQLDLLRQQLDAAEYVIGRRPQNYKEKQVLRDLAERCAQYPRGGPEHELCVRWFVDNLVDAAENGGPGELEDLTLIGSNWAYHSSGSFLTDVLASMPQVWTDYHSRGMASLLDAFANPDPDVVEWYGGDDNLTDDCLNSLTDVVINRQGDVGKAALRVFARFAFGMARYSSGAFLAAVFRLIEADLADVVLRDYFNNVLAGEAAPLDAHMAQRLYDKLAEKETDQHSLNTRYTEHIQQLFAIMGSYQQLLEDIFGEVTLDSDDRAAIRALAQKRWDSPPLADQRVKELTQVASSSYGKKRAESLDVLARYAYWMIQKSDVFNDCLMQLIDEDLADPILQSLLENLKSWACVVLPRGDRIWRLYSKLLERKLGWGQQPPSWAYTEYLRLLSDHLAAGLSRATDGAYLGELGEQEVEAARRILEDHNSARPPDNEQQL